MVALILFVTSPIQVVIAYNTESLTNTKVGLLPMAISSEFRMGQYRGDDHREDAPHFTERMNPK